MSAKGERRAGHARRSIAIVPALLLRLCRCASRGYLLHRPRSYVRNIRRLRDLSSLGVGDQDSRMIEQETDGSIQFYLGFFVRRLGGDER